jgi:hypothetical protein
MPVADSQMTTSFFMLQSLMLDAGFSILEALSIKSEALNKSKPQMINNSKNVPKARRFSP